MATWPITDNSNLLHDLKNDHHHNLITITHDLQDCIDDSEFNILPFQSHFQQSSTTLSENDGSNQIDTVADDKKYNPNTNDQQKQTIQYELMYVFNHSFTYLAF